MSAQRAEPSGAAAAERNPLREAREAARVYLEQGRAAEGIEYLLAALAGALRHNRDLELLVLKYKRELHGRSSEKLDRNQLQLLFAELVAQGTSPVAVDEKDEDAEDESLDREIASEKQKRRKPGRRKKRGTWSTPEVENVTHTVAVADSERTCPECGEERKTIGHDRTTRLVFVPGHFVEETWELEKRACGRCKEGVATAPAPPAILNRCAADASILAHLVVSKFIDHTPLHRFSRILDRGGVVAPVSTLADWVAGCGELVQPVVDALEGRVLRAFLVRTDATGLKVLDRSKAENIRRGTIWAVIGDDRDVVFRYAPTGEGAEGPWKILAGRTGYIQADASNTLDRLFNGRAANAIEVGCLAHARRRLEALKDIDCRVAYPLRLIARLYRIERLADVRELAPAGRTALRQERSAPVLEKLKRWYALTAANERPASDLAAAANYGVNHWKALTRFLDDGRLSLDNNLTERQLRDIAIGRKNYLFAGSSAAARHAASLYSLARTCAQYGVPPLAYFTELFKRLARGWPGDRLVDLLPHNWDAMRQVAPGPAAS